MELSILKRQRDLWTFRLKGLAVQLQARKDERNIKRSHRVKKWIDAVSDSVFLVREVCAIPIYERKQREYFKTLEDEYRTLEPFLIVAGLPLREPFAWKGDTALVFPHRSLPGEVDVKWDTGHLFCNLTYWGGCTQNAAPAFGTLGSAGKIISESTFGGAKCPDNSLSLDGIVDQFLPMFPTTLTVEFHPATATRCLSENPVAFTRYSYLGVRLRRWRNVTSRFVVISDGYQSARMTTDSDDTQLFGRRARITQTSDVPTPSSCAITVTFAGTPLSNEDERIIRHVISFVAGARGKLICEEWFGADAEHLGGRYYNASDPSPTKSPPFEMFADDSTFVQETWSCLCDGFSRLVMDGYPLFAALYHLHDANAENYEVEIKNLLFCIHALFERWADVNGQRKIIPKASFKRARDLTQACAAGFFGCSEETLLSVCGAIGFANERRGSILQDLFFDSLGIVLDSTESEALHMRNQLFHRGYINHDATNMTDVQRLLDDARALRTLANLSILKLAGYNGPVYDWQHFRNRDCATGYPDI